MKSELKITGAASAVGGLPILLEVLRGDSGLTENMTLVLLGCVTALVSTYNLARGQAKTEIRNGAPAASTGKKSSEFKMSVAAAGAGALPVLTDMLRGGELLSERIRMALVISITIISLSYTASRGMAKVEKREATPPPSNAD